MAEKTLAVIQARLGSTRLPRKVLAEIGGESVLSRVVNRVRRAEAIDEVVVATSAAAEDNEIAELSASLGVGCVRGSAEDVLDRFHAAAKKLHPDWVVRVNADNPFLSTRHLDELVQSSRRTETDYASYRVGEKPAMLTTCGFFAELMSAACLERAAETLNERIHREHVTLGIYTAPADFSVHFIDAPGFANQTWLRLTLDTAGDLELLRTIAAAEPEPDESAEALVQRISSRPAWVSEMERLNLAQPK